MEKNVSFNYAMEILIGLSTELDKGEVREKIDMAIQALDDARVDKDGKSPY